MHTFVEFAMLSTDMKLHRVFDVWIEGEYSSWVNRGMRMGYSRQPEHLKRAAHVRVDIGSRQTNKITSFMNHLCSTTNGQRIQC
jgi:hypothetical protein